MAFFKQTALGAIWKESGREQNQGLSEEPRAVVQQGDEDRLDKDVAAELEGSTWGQADLWRQTTKHAVIK